MLLFGAGQRAPDEHALSEGEHRLEFGDTPRKVRVWWRKRFVRKAGDGRRDRLRSAWTNGLPRPGRMLRPFERDHDGDVPPSETGTYGPVKSS
jgi:hypothetical protein